MWQKEGLFCLTQAADGLFLVLFYANICQFLVSLFLLLGFLSWNAIVGRWLP
jgi:hypothetical protein